MDLNIKKSAKTSFMLIVVVFAIIGIFATFTYSKKYSENAKYQSIIDTTYLIYAIPFPENVTFGGDKVPTENFDVREALDKELHKVTYWQSEMLLYIKRANRYFPIIEPILERNNIPDDMKYLCVAESGLTNAGSPAGAKGFWQFMKPTAEYYKLIVNDEIDERYNLVKSTEAACKLLKSMYRKYKDWALVAASYNTGPGNVDKQLKKQQVKSYYDMLLNTETGRYVYRILAMKTILENPKLYGFRYRKKDLYPELYTKEVVIDSSINNIVDFAKKNNTTYKMVRILNPWLKGNKLTNSKSKKYTFTLLRDNGRSAKYFQYIDDADIIIGNCDDE